MARAQENTLRHASSQGLSLPKRAHLPKSTQLNVGLSKGNARLRGQGIALKISQLVGTVRVPSQEATHRTGREEGEQDAWESSQVQRLQLFYLSASSQWPDWRVQGPHILKGSVLPTPLSLWSMVPSLALCATWPRGATGPEIQLCPARRALCLDTRGAACISGMSATSARPCCLPFLPAGEAVS